MFSEFKLAPYAGKRGLPSQGLFHRMLPGNHNRAEFPRHAVPGKKACIVIMMH